LKLPLVSGWIDQTLAIHAAKVRPVSDFGFERLPKYYSATFLAGAKVIPIERVPMPPLSQFELPEFGEFEKGDYAGVTYKNTYFVQSSRLMDESLHFHELVHVVQWAQMGVEGFLLAYAAGLAAHGYRNSPLEAMAYGFQAYFDQNGKPEDMESVIKTKLSELRLNPTRD